MDNENHDQIFFGLYSKTCVLNILKCSVSKTVTVFIKKNTLLTTFNLSSIRCDINIDSIMHLKNKCSVKERELFLRL